MVENIGKRLKEIRTVLALSQEALGRKLSLSKQAISNVENNLSNPSISFLNKLLEVCNVNINWFTYGTGLMFLNNCENTHAFVKNDKALSDYNNWGKRLLGLLSEAEETPLSFSKRTGIKESRIEKFILDSAEPTISEINAIKSNVDVSIDWLLYAETVEKTNTQAKNNLSLSADEIFKIKKLLNDSDV